MSIRSNLPFSLAALAVSVAAALAAPTYAASSAPAAKQSRPAGIDADALASEIRSSVQSAVEEAKQAARDVHEQLPMTLAQIDFDDVMLDAPALAYVGELGGGREIVKNAPYTAEAVTESVQTFGDGNRIVKRSSASLARDTLGRTRQERKRERGSSVYIYDPIEGKSYALNTERKTAARIPRVPVAPMAPMTPVAPEVPAPPAAPPPPGKATSVTRGGNEVHVEPGRVLVRKAGANGEPAEEVRVEVIRMARAEHEQAHNEMPMPSFTMPLMPRGKGERQALGTRDFEGVKAEGTRISHTIPAGAIGNEKPIVIATERWFSPELNVVVFAKTTDPRAGETTYRLTGIKRGEPPAGLFRVPEDYRMRGGGDSGK